MANKRTISVKTTYADSGIYFEFSDSLDVPAGSQEDWIESKKREMMRTNLIAINNWVAETSEKKEKEQ